MKAITWCLLLIVLAAAPALGAGQHIAPAAAEKNAKVSQRDPRLTALPPELAEAPDARTILTRVSLGAFAVLGLCAGGLLLIRRWLRRGQTSGQPGSQMQVLESLSLGYRCRVLLVQAGDRQLLVGLDSGGMKTLLSLPEPLEFSPSDEEPPIDPWASP
jgi:flagellar protein FliO/FliZ